MGFFDRFKKEKKPVPKKPEKKVEKKIEKKEVKPEKKVEEKKQVRKKITGEAYWILKQPLITEKATFLGEKDQYVFKVSSRANKVQIKKAVEDLYGINVLGVRIINVHSKKRRLGRSEGSRSGYKKAIVKIKKGQKIEILPR